jgi:hypothetical protein
LTRLLFTAFCDLLLQRRPKQREVFKVGDATHLFLNLQQASSHPAMTLIRGFPVLDAAGVFV